MDNALNNPKLNALKFSASQRYFIQRWCELLGPDTSDARRYRVMHAPSSLEELVSFLTGQTPSARSLLAILEECISLLKEDPVLAHKASTAVTQVLSHLTSAEQKVKQAIEKDKSVPKPVLLSLQYHAKSAWNGIKTGYPQWLEEVLRELLFDPVKGDIIKHLKNVDKVTSLLVTELIRAGHSQFSLLSLKGEFEDDTKDPKDKFNTLLALIQAPKKPYDCIFTTPVVLKTAINEFGGIAFESGKVLQGRPGGSTLSEQKTYMTVKVEAHDAESAFISAVRLVTKATDELAFFQVMEPWPKKSPSAKVVHGTTVEDKNSSDVVAWHRLAAYVSSLLNSTFQIDSITKLNCTESTRQRLHDTFAYSRLSALSPFEEVGFLNLWVALESLLSTEAIPGNLGPVLERIPAIMQNHYFYRLVKDFVEDCKSCGILVETARGPLDYNKPPREVARDFLTILRDVGLTARLRAACRHNYTLLDIRCQEIIDAIRNGTSAAETLTRHTVKVTHHLQRLYRLRNQLVHAASTQEQLYPDLIRTLREYLTVTVVSTVSYLQLPNYHSTEEAFATMVDNASATLTVLNDLAGKAVDESLLVEGALLP